MLAHAYICSLKHNANYIFDLRNYFVSLDFPNSYCKNSLSYTFEIIFFVNKMIIITAKFAKLLKVKNTCIGTYN